jgi:hypothetical protein
MLSSSAGTLSQTGAPLGGNPARRKGQKNRSPPAGNVDQPWLIFGASREEAPEEVFVSCAMRLQNLPSGRRRAKQDAMSGCPKKGRRRGAADRFSDRVRSSQEADAWGRAQADNLPGPPWSSCSLWTRVYGQLLALKLTWKGGPMRVTVPLGGELLATRTTGSASRVARKCCPKWVVNSI